MDSNREVAPYFPSSYQPSALKDMDLVNWLEKKLNDAGAWSGRNTASMLTREILEELETCFQAIDMQTKLKIICCIPHMNPRKLSTVHSSISVLLDLASQDADDWVETIGDMYRDVPSAGVINPSCSNKDSHFSRTLEDMTRCFEKHLESGNLKLSPEGHNIVSSSVNKAIFGASPEPQKLFMLRKKPKSFNLMNDMMKQCAKLVEANREKNSGLWSTTAPFKNRPAMRSGFSNLPMKGIPTQNPCKLNSGFTYEPKKYQRQLVKREGGAKLLDICELPQSLKRRRQLELIEERKRKQEEKEMAKKKALEEKKEKELAKKAAQPKHLGNSKRQCEKDQLPANMLSQPTNDGDGQVSHPEVSGTIERRHSGPSMLSSGDTENLQISDSTQQQPELAQERRDVPEVPMFHETVNPISQRGIQNNQSQNYHHLQRNQSQFSHQQHFPPQQPQHSAMTSKPGYSESVCKPAFVRDQRTAAQRAREIAIMNQCNEMLHNANSLDQNGRQLVIAFMTGNKCTLIRSSLSLGVYLLSSRKKLVTYSIRCATIV
ncbi:hypothetical protein KIN20_019579 [Parelaphostrongylus tenuis]|uniref:HDAg domain-containing protein n=1 Tax=Parelaphostrongylus tenuis TaxID=148309 RepID=A0AAD5QV53_PARTN|nr:hypothetical protein KIN20_019579 [Parelaphostrongylus tenuis]